MSSSPEQTPRTIAFFSPELVNGGTQRHLLEVLRLIDRTRFVPMVISAKGHGPLGDAVRSAGAALVELGLGPSMVSRDFWRCVREATSALRAHRVGIVQYFEWRAGTIALLAARRAGGCRIVAARRSVNKERGVQRWLADLVVHAADRIIVNSDLLRPAGRAGERTDVIPSGVDTDRFRPTAERGDAKARLGLDPKTPVIGTVGRLEPRKGTAVLVAALGALRAAGRPLAAVIVGDGPLRDELVRDVAARGLTGSVQLLGDRSDVREVLAALDVFVLPSRTEGMSNALLEAMAMGLPVVATAVGGNQEVVTDGRSGVLVPADAAGAMAAAIARVLDDGAFAAALGSAARRAVEERYGARSMVRRLEAVYAAAAAGETRALAAERAALVAAPELEGADPR